MERGKATESVVRCAFCGSVRAKEREREREMQRRRAAKRGFGKRGKWGRGLVREVRGPQFGGKYQNAKASP